ncbi:ParB N-terminal domain-containing protein [Natronorarus salvus]|uniref:hypothetical protein n=1 Tax=Natronorarus salvus TaxID=3117733 RepID=UPI002F26A3A9
MIEVFKHKTEKPSLGQIGYKTLKNKGIYHFIYVVFKFIFSKMDEAMLSHFPIYHGLRVSYYEYKTILTSDYDAPLNPYKIEWVDPDDINEFTRRNVRPVQSCGLIKNGNWDRRDDYVYSEGYGKRYWHNRARNGIYFEDSLFYQALKNHFDHGIDWKETEYFQAASKAFEIGEKISNGYTSEQELLLDFKRTDELYHEIKNNGYKTRADVNKWHDYDRGVMTFKKLKKSEITVDIGRNGKLLFASSGKHRLAIAKILGLDEIPVIFICRHRNWMNHRDYIYRNELKVYHPDLSEFQ